MASEKSCLITTAAVIAFILLCILLPLSFQTITVHEYGVLYNSITKSLHKDDVVSSVLTFRPVGWYYITFPRLLRYFEFSFSSASSSPVGAVDVWTRDGQNLILEVGFYARVQPGRVLSLYYNYGTEFDAVWRDLAEQAIKDVAVNFTTDAFFLRRGAVNAALGTRISERLATAYAEMSEFNLQSIDLPDDFESSVVDKLITNQQRITLGLEQQSDVIREQIAVTLAESQRDIAVLRREVLTQGTVIRANATAQAFVRIAASQAELFSNLSTTLQLDADDAQSNQQLLQYMWLDALRNMDPSTTKLVSGFSNVVLQQ